MVAEDSRGWAESSQGFSALGQNNWKGKKGVGRPQAQHPKRKKMPSTSCDGVSALCHQYYTFKFQANGSQRTPLPLLTAK